MGALALGTLVIIIGGLLYVKRKSLEFLYNRTYWAIGALVSFNVNRKHELSSKNNRFLGRVEKGFELTCIIAQYISIYV